MAFSCSASVGRRVQLVVSDPWDLVAPDGSVRFDATVMCAATYSNGAEEERLVIRLLNPTVWHEQTIEFFVARERHGRGLVDDLALGQAVECALIAIEAGRAHSSDPFDTSWWRGGLAANASLHGL